MSKLQGLRKAKMLKQSELAEKTGLGISTIRAFEQGQRNINKAELTTLLKLCNTLGCRLPDILDDGETLAELERYKRND